MHIVEWCWGLLAPVQDRAIAELEADYDAIAEAGHRAGLSGKPRSTNPEAKPPRQQHWDNNWLRGNQERAP